MRLRKIQSILMEHTEKLLAFTDVKGNSSSHNPVADYPLFMKSVREIEKTHIFDDVIIKLNESDLYLITEHQQIRFSVDKISTLNSIALELYNKCTGALSLISSVFDESEEKSDSLIVSLPNRTIDLDEFESIIVDINSIFSLLSIHPEFRKDTPKLANLDVGSDWLVIAFYSAGALFFFGKFISISLTAAQQIKSNKIINKSLEHLDVDEETKKTYREAMSKINISIYEKYANLLLEDVENLEAVPENLAQIAKAIAKANGLFSVGVAFESSINASNKIAETFPKLIEQQSNDYFKSLIDLKKLSDQTINREDSETSE